MKRLCVLLAFALLFLTACTSDTDSTAYTVEKQGITFVVDTDACTITEGENIYRYKISDNNITITYPNNATYWWTITGSSGAGGWSDDYDDSAYVDGTILTDILEYRIQKNSEPKNILLALILATLGIWYTAAPYSAWYISYGWIYKGAEPSNAALALARISGVAVIIFAVILLFI